MSTWARVEFVQIDGFQNSYRCKLVVEGDVALREVLKRKLVVGTTDFCRGTNDIHERQARLHASLNANCGTTFFPLFRLFELLEGEGYTWVCAPSSPDREVHMFRKN